MLNDDFASSAIEAYKTQNLFGFVFGGPVGGPRGGPDAKTFCRGGPEDPLVLK